MRFGFRVKVVVFLVFFSVSFFVFLGGVIGADVHTCEWTTDNKFCVEDDDITFAKYGGCRSGYINSYKTIDQVEGCKIGTCVPSKTGQCLASKFKAACVLGERGTFYDRPLEQVEDCKIGCCNVKDTFCSLEQRKVCVKDRANGDVNAFVSSTTDKVSCDNSCRGADLGCFKANDGTCRYGIRENFGGDGEFFANSACSDVVECFVQSRAYKSCGNGLENNDYINVYYYDSQRNREEIAQACNYPDEICFDADKVGGQDAVCVTTKCVESCASCTPQEFRSGESICQNVPGGHFLNDKRSTALNNYIFRCQYGEIVPDTRDVQREKRCNQELGGDGRIHANWVDNKYKSCHDCGEGSDSITDWAGFVPVIGPPVAAGLLFGLGESCANLHGLSTKCDGRGDCVYDKDFIWPPIGSCNPSFPPSKTKSCQECGGGGDSSTNICSREECNRLGDCQFEAETVNSESIGATLGVGIGTCASALAVTYALCGLPLIGQGGCPGFLATAKKLCLTNGENRIYHSLIASVYSFGAGAASGESAAGDTGFFGALDAGSILEGDRVPLGTAIVLSKAVLTNLSSDKTISRQLAKEAGDVISNINDDGTSELGTGIGSGVFSITTSTLVPYISNYFYNELLVKTTTKTLVSVPGPLLIGQERVSVIITEVPGGTVFVENLNFIIQKISYAMLPLSIARSFDSGKCKAEEPYTDNSRCSQCGPGEGQWFCTKARCDILGGSSGHCSYVPIDGVVSGVCLPKDKTDATNPYVTKINANFLDINGANKLQKESNSKSLRLPEKLPWDVITLDLTIATNEKADCRFTRDANNSYENSRTFGDEGFPTTHTTQINFSETDKVSGATLFFKCKDINSNEITRDDDTNFIAITFDKRPDSFPPVIQKIDPQNSFLPDTVKSVVLSLVVFDEQDVQECRYSKTTPNYDEMENTFDRGEKITCQDTNNKDCRLFSREVDLADLDATTFNLTGFEKEVTSYTLSIKCKDTSGNIMYQEQNWSLFAVPTFNLEIGSPIDGDETFNRVLTINVTTSVSSMCNYTLDGKEFFLGDFDREHIKEHPRILDEGDHQLKVTCRDVASNRVDKVVDFKVLIDTKPPELTRIFKEVSKLCITLDEGGVECRYENRDIFPSGWVNAIVMIDSRKPNSLCASLDEDKIYYIMCKDSWDNNKTLTIYP